MFNSSTDFLVMATAGQAVSFMWWTCQQYMTVSLDTGGVTSSLEGCDLTPLYAGSL